MLNNEEFQLQRYQDFEVYVTYKINSKSSVTTTIWHEHSLDLVGIANAQIVMSSYRLDNLTVSSKSKMNVSASILYVQNASDFAGLFTS